MNDEGVWIVSDVGPDEEMTELSAFTTYEAALKRFDEIRTVDPAFGTRSFPYDEGSDSRLLAAVSKRGHRVLRISNPIPIGPRPLVVVTVLGGIADVTDLGGVDVVQIDFDLFDSEAVSAEDFEEWAQDVEAARPLWERISPEDQARGYIRRSIEERLTEARERAAETNSSDD